MCICVVAWLREAKINVFEIFSFTPHFRGSLILFFLTLTLAFETNSAASPNCTFFRILAYYDK